MRMATAGPSSVPSSTQSLSNLDVARLPMSERPDPVVEAHKVRQAAEHQRACTTGLSDERLQLVADRLTADKVTDRAIRDARLAVVDEELRRRHII